MEKNRTVKLKFVYIRCIPAFTIFTLAIFALAIFTLAISAIYIADAGQLANSLNRVYLNHSRVVASNLAGKFIAVNAAGRSLLVVHCYWHSTRPLYCCSLKRLVEDSGVDVLENS